MPGGIVSRIIGYFRGKRYPTYQEYFANYSAWHVVSSSNVSSVAFYESQGSVSGNVLGVRFKNKKTGGVTTYYYPGISRGQFNALMSAGSKGKWIHQNLKVNHSPYMGPL